jgi:RNase P subunit RPR2
MMVTEETTQENLREVTCMFCGTTIEAPAPKPARRSAGREKSFSVAIVRCRVCGKEAPYQFKNPEMYSEQVKVAGAD